MIQKPKKVATRLGTFGEVLYALAPKSVDVILNTAFKLFPESAAAKGEKKKDEEVSARGSRVRAPDARSALVVAMPRRPRFAGASTGAGATRTSSRRPRSCATAAEGIRGHLGFGDGRRRGAGPARAGGAARAAARPRPARWRRSARPTPTSAPRTRTARPTATSCAPSAGASTTCPTSSPARATRARSRERARVVRRARRGGDPVRRRDERRRRRGGARSASGYAGAVTIDLGAARPGARGRPHLARGADPGRRDGPGARGPAARARPHAAPLPAVVPALDARRLDRDARRRPLRDALHAHRRPRRVDHGGHARGRRSRRGACPARARGRAPTACCSARRGSSA